MAFLIPLDLPHAGRIADRIRNLLERHLDEHGLAADDVLGTCERLSRLLWDHTENDENPPEPLATETRDAAATLGRRLVDELEAAGIQGDRLGQYVRNLFECLELGDEGATISLRAGENPASLQRPL